MGLAIAQVVSPQPPTTEKWVQSEVSLCGLYDGQYGTGTGFSPSSLVFPLSVPFHQRSIIIHSSVICVGYSLSSWQWH